jgi:hypothetical protein
MDNIELTHYGRRRDQVVGGENVNGEESDDGPSVAAAVDYEQIPDDSPSTIAGPLPIDDKGGPTADDNRPIKCPSLPCGRSRQPIGLSSDDGEGISSGDVYTVEDAIDRLGFGPFQIIITIFSGVLSMADAMEVMLLSVLSPIVACEWNLENYQQSMITSVMLYLSLLSVLFEYNFNFKSQFTVVLNSYTIIIFLHYQFVVLLCVKLGCFYWILFWRFILGCNLRCYRTKESLDMRVNFDINIWGSQCGCP